MSKGEIKLSSSDKKDLEKFKKSVSDAVFNAIEEILEEANAGAADLYLDRIAKFTHKWHEDDTPEAYSAPVSEVLVSWENEQVLIQLSFDIENQSGYKESVPKSPYDVKFVKESA